jgi:hypothetical protein
MSDPINPRHYKHLPVEAIDIIEAAISKAPSNESAYLHGQVLKYMLRCWEKKGIEDLRKAKWYLDRMVASFDEVLAKAIETPSDPPKQYREPTQEDLANGPIECEVKNFDDDEWEKVRLTSVDLPADYIFRFVARKLDSRIFDSYAQCRIEVAE